MAPSDPGRYVPIRSSFRLLLPLGVLVVLAGCSSDTAVKPPENLAGYYGPETAPNSGTVFGDQGLVFGTGHNIGRNRDNAGGGTLGVNAYLWRSALDTLSFMPLASADPFGGVIITDWYSPPATANERFKATTFILGRELRTDALRVSIFRQVFQDGHWVDANVSGSTVGDIEDKILDRARQLRAQVVASQ
ncbi:MAG: DUF3576 domain-containing protein [Pseudomonadota bacterium]|nr:DUF3576 domain-containing protein [Pseudomonadota bacterium]